MTRPTTRGPALLDQPESPAWWAAVDGVREDLRRDGCAVLRGFVPPERHDRLRREGVGVAPHAYSDVEIVTVYNTDPADDLPIGHPGRRLMERGNAFVPGDRIPADLLIAQLHRSPEFLRFLAACVEVPVVHPLADPLAGLCLNVVQPGREHPWHFDTNEFAVTLLTQAPQGGGVFEYVPNIRSAESERFGAVTAVLDGSREGVRRLHLRVGDLQIFRGRHSLHRVTPVTGTVDRHTAVLSYSERPDVIGSVERTRQLFGRVLPVHVAAARSRSDDLLD